MKRLLFRGLIACLAVCVASATPDRARADMVAVIGGNSNATITSFLNANGHTATNFGNAVPVSLAGFDAVVLLRTPGNATVQNFVLGGGLLITEWDASAWALNTANLINADDGGGAGFIGTGTLVTFTAAGVNAGLSAGLGASYSDGPRTEFFRNLINIGAGVDILATRPGNNPAIIGGSSGAGATLIIGYDWADSFPAGTSASGTLLLNALNYNPGGVAVVPEPSTLLLGALGAMGLLGYRRVRR
jgi:hypothetical protein